MKIGTIQNIGFNKIDPKLKKEIMAERRELTNDPADLECFENSLKYLEYTDLFELKKSEDRKKTYRLEFTSPLVHEGPIEHFIKPESPSKEDNATKPRVIQTYRKFMNKYGANFANQSYDKLADIMAVSLYTTKGFYLKSEENLYSTLFTV